MLPRGAGSEVSRDFLGVIVGLRLMFGGFCGSGAAVVVLESVVLC